VQARNATRAARIAEERRICGRAGAAIAIISRELRDGLASKCRSRIEALLLSILAPDRSSAASTITRDIVELDHRGQRVALWTGSSQRQTSDRLPAYYPHLGAQARRVPPVCVPRGLFPSLEFRRAYDALALGGADQADLDYVRILHLAASDANNACEWCSRRIGRRDHSNLRSSPSRGARRAHTEGMPYLEITPPDLAVYDRLLGANTAAVCV